MKHTIKLFLGAIISFNCFATDNLICHTTRHEKSYMVAGEQVSLLQPSKTDESFRKIASATRSRARTSKGGIYKVISYENKKHKFVIQDKNNLNELNDYVTITNHKGHKITYPINCERI